MSVFLCRLSVLVLELGSAELGMPAGCVGLFGRPPIRCATVSVQHYPLQFVLA